MEGHDNYFSSSDTESEADNYEDDDHVDKICRLLPITKKSRRYRLKEESSRKRGVSPPTAIHHSPSVRSKIRNDETPKSSSRLLSGSTPNAQKSHAIRSKTNDDTKVMTALEDISNVLKNLVQRVENTEKGLKAVENKIVTSPSSSSDSGCSKRKFEVPLVVRVRMQKCMCIGHTLSLTTSKVASPSPAAMVRIWWTDHT